MIEVLLLGGTGAMGTFLVDILAKSKINCVVTSRSKKIVVIMLRIFVAMQKMTHFYFLF